MIFNRFRTSEKLIEDPIDSLSPLKDPNLKIYNYSDVTKMGDTNFILEKRRRHQIYTLLDYIFSGTTPIAFFSIDTIHILKQAKQLAEASKLFETKDKNLDSDFILLSFLYSDSDFSKILKFHKIIETKVEDEIVKQYTISDPSTKNGKNSLSKIFNFSFSFIKSFIFSKSVSFTQIKFGENLRKIFKRMTINSFERFKTPVITPEILFLTLMENRKMKAGRIISDCLSYETNKTEWYILRYKLIKRIHYQEINIRTQKKNIHFFAYLLKLNSSEADFNQMIENKVLDLAILTFRNKIIAQMLTLNLFDLLEKDIKKESHFLKERTYSK